MKVELIAYTPNPDAVCNMAAGTCVSEDIPVLETSVNKYRALKGALAAHHASVAEHATFSFAISGVSRALTHQLIRHRLASYSQQSQRYIKMDDFEYVIPDSIKDSDKRIWMTSWEDWIPMLDAYNSLMDDIQQTYEQMVDAGIPEEDARYILPNACCTNIVVSMNGRELRHLFALRCCSRAQAEIRELANRMLELCKEVAPVLFENAGPSCVQLGYCPEKKSCRKVKKSQNESD